MTAKPPICVHNIDGVREDRVLMAYALDQAVTGLANLGHGGSAYDAQNGYLVADGLSWGNDALGGYAALDAAGGTKDSLLVIDKYVDAPVQYPRATIHITFAEGGNGATAESAGTNHGAALFATSKLISAFSSARVVIDDPAGGTKTLKCTLRSNAGAIKLYSAAISGAHGDTHTLVFRFGEPGFHAHLDGVLMTPNGFVGSDYTQGIILADSQKMTVGGIYNWTTGANESCFTGKIRNVTVWNWQLQDRERNLIEVDPSLPLRPRPSGLTKDDVAAWIGRVNATSATVRMVTADDLAGTAYFRVSYSTDPQLATAEHVDASESQSDTELDIVLADLTPDTHYYLIVQTSSDGQTWYALPGGRQELHTQRAPGSPFAVNLVADDHLVNYSMNGDYTPQTLGDAGHIMSLIGESDPSRKLIAHDLAARDMAVRGAADFTINLGDSAFQSQAVQQATQSERDPVAEVDGAIVSLKRRWAPALRAGPMDMKGGNHDGEPAYTAEVNLGVVAPTQRIATEARKKHFPFMVPGTYPEFGGHDAEHESNELAAVGNNWIPALDDHHTVAWRDTYIGYHDAAGRAASRNRSPLGNYGLKLWGDAIFVYLDEFRYTGVGDYQSGGSHTRPAMDWRLGSVQWGEIEAGLDYAVPRFIAAHGRRPWVFFCLHHRLGGEPIGIGQGSVPYGRGSGLRVITAEDIRLSRLAARYKGVILKAHDHRYAVVWDEYGVLNVTVPSTSAPSVFNSGWNFPEMEASYGKAELLGQDVDRVVMMINTLGYVRLEVTSDTVTFVLCETYLPVAADLHTLLLDRKRHFGQPLGQNGLGTVTLEERPRDVFHATFAAEVDVAQDPAWFTKEVTELTRLDIEQPPGDVEDEAWAGATIHLNPFTLGGSTEDVAVAYVPRTAHTFTVDSAPVQASPACHPLLMAALQEDSQMNVTVLPALVATGEDQPVEIPRGARPMIFATGAVAELRSEIGSDTKLTLPANTLIPLGVSLGQTIYLRAAAGTVIEIALT